MSDISYHRLNRIVLLGLFLNIFVILLWCLSKEPRVVHSVETVVTNHLIVVTNYLDTASGGVAMIPDDPRGGAVKMRYRYMSQGSRVYAYDGYNYLSKGSPTPWGRVLRIYPLCIELDNGVRVWNTQEPYFEDVRGDFKLVSFKDDTYEGVESNGKSRY